MEVLHVDDMSFDIDHNLKRIIFSQRGSLNKANAVDSIVRINQLEGFDPSYDTLVDYIEIASIDISALEIKEIVNGLNEIDKRTGKTALVAGPSIPRYALAKLYCDLACLIRDARFRAFKDCEAARDWLAQ